MNRRLFLASVGAALLSTRALAQSMNNALDDYDGEVYRPDKDTAEWFEGLDRPDYDASLMATKSCCSSGDAYPIKILQEATIGGKEPDGLAIITDGSAREIILPNGSKKYRLAITGSLTLHFAGEKVTREIRGNPTKTAWAFLRVLSGEVDYTYCIVPLPPSF